MNLDPPDYFYCDSCKGHMDNYFYGENGVCEFCLEDKKDEEDEDE
jgi:hypothetical protein